MDDCCGKIEAWAGSAVDTRCIHPVGKRAHNHFVLWKQTRYVISGKWCQGNVALMLSAFRPWRWETEREKHSGLFVSISSRQFDLGIRIVRSSAGCGRSHQKGEQKETLVPWPALRRELSIAAEQQHGALLATSCRASSRFRTRTMRR